MSQPARTFRLFISSTFSDLKEERNALQRTVFPALRKLCEEAGFRFQAIDLRWGVREEAGLDQRAMRICLEEVKRSQAATPRPNFLVLLGQRYGWRPLPAEIPAGEWQQLAERLRAHGTDGEEQLERLRQWYRLDLNARSSSQPPGAWLLRPRTEPPFDDYRTWEREVERPLREILASAARASSLPADAQLKYWASATEQEIERGALRVPDAREHVFCFLRTIDGLPADRTAGGYRDLTPDGLPDREAEGLLERLRGGGGKLEGSLGAANLYHYRANWLPAAEGRPGEDGSPISLGHLEPFCRDMETVLGGVIRAEIARLERLEQDGNATDLDREQEEHGAFCRERTRFFRGRTVTLQGVASYLAAADPRPLALIGEPGSGKSAVLARAVEAARQAPGDARVLFRFIGWTPGSAVARDLLDSLCRELRPAGPPPPSEYRELVRELSARLRQAAEDGPVLVFLDGLDQLSEADGARNLAWLPAVLPPNVRLVVSSSTEPGDTLEVLERRLPAENRLRLEDLAVEDAHELLGLWLADPEVDRTLQGRAESAVACTGQWRHLLDHYRGCRRPLFLRLAFEEARRWRSFDETADLPLAADIPGLIEQLFDRLSSSANHGATIVARSLGYLVAGKHGLTEDELIDVLSRDPDVAVEVRRIHRPPEEQLPVVIWSRLLFDLQPYLTRRSADRATVLAFFHRQLDQVARRRYLEPDRAARHGALARFFGGQPLFLCEGESRRANLRKLSELPFQETRACHGASPADSRWSKLLATLTDFDFLEAKCTFVAVTPEPYGAMMRRVYNGIYELQQDYRRALDHLPAVASAGPSERGLRASLEQWLRFLVADAQLLRWRPPLLFQQAANQPAGTSPSELAERRQRSGAEQRAWFRWTNRPPCLPTALLTLAERSESVAQLWVWDVAFSPDGGGLVSAGDDETLRLWDLRTGVELARLRHSATFYRCAFWQDAQHVVGGSFDGSWTWTLWDVLAGTLLATHRQNEPGAAPDWALACPTPEQLAGARWRELSAREPGAAASQLVACSKAGERVLGSTGSSFTVWDLPQGTRLSGFTALVPETDSRAYAFSPDGRRVLAAGPGWTLQLHDAESGVRLAILRGHADLVTACRFSPDGRYAASGSWDGTTRLWDVDSTGEPGLSARHDGRIHDCEFSPDGSLLATVGGDELLKVWDVAVVTERAVVRAESGSAFWRCTFSPNGMFVFADASGAPGSRAFRSASAAWMVATGRTLMGTDAAGHFTRFGGSAKRFGSTVHSPDGRLLAEVTDDGTLVLRNARTGALRPVISEAHVVNGQAEEVVRCGFSPDSRRLLSVSDRALELWDVRTGAQLAQYVAPGLVSAVDWSPDGESLALGLVDGALHLLRLENSGSET